MRDRPFVPGTPAAGTTAASDETVVRVRGLHKWYGAIHALDGVDLELRSGEVLGFLGPNGAGKTTFTKCVLGFVRPSEGSVELFGRDIRTHRMEVLSRVGLVPDQYDFYGNLTGTQHLEFYGRLHRIPKADLAGRIAEVTQTVAMGEFVERKVNGYSHGMKQRLCIAQALINRPQFLIFDEPTNGLDPRGAYETRQLIKALARQGHTIFMSSHILSEVEDVCTTVAILSRGKILVQASVAELRRRVGGGVARVSIRLANPDARFVALAREQGGATGARLESDVLKLELGGQTKVPDMVGLLVKNGAHVMGVEEAGADLEQIFLELTKGEGGV